MLILGQKYILTQLEKEQLKKHFSFIEEISYKDKDVEAVIEKINNYVQRGKPSLIVLNTKAQVPHELIKYLTALQFEKNIHYISIEHFLEEYLYKCYIPESNEDLHFLDDVKPFSKWQYMQKRLIDYTVSLSLLFLTAPVLLYSRYRIKKESPGTSMFKQYRVGLNGKEFKCMKFRSMVPDAEQGIPRFASKDDPRVFRWGAVMRKTRIDEIPQVMNVLKGEMHMIGPRPERKYWVEQFEKEIPYYNLRHIVRPGITGWAQVMYPYGAGVEDAKQKLMYDLYYIKHWSIMLEIKVIFKTIEVMLKKKGV